MTLSFFVPERSPVTALQQKLNQLSLTSMVAQLDQTIAEAAAKNRSFAEILESLVDGELEARNSPFHRAPLPPLAPARPILHRQLSVQTPQEPPGPEATPSSPARSGVHRQRRRSHFYRQSRRGKDLPGENHRLARLPGESARALHHGHGHAQSPAGFPGRSLSYP